MIFTGIPIDTDPIDILTLLILILSTAFRLMCVVVRLYN